MKRLFLGIITIIIFSTSALGQNYSKAAACNADCLFNDCAIKCPSGTNPRCSCIVGSFSSCKCVGIADRSAQQTLTIKNESQFATVITFLDQNDYKDFKELFQLVFNSLKRSNLDEFNINFDKLESLAVSNPEAAAKIKAYIDTLKR